MLENTEAWDKEVTISLPATIPGTQDRFCTALREELTKKNHDFEQDFLSALQDETGRDWTEPFPVDIWQFETESGHEINVNSDEDASSAYNYISASDEQLWELLSAGLRGVLRVYFKDGPNEINVLEIRLLITLQREDALPEVTFICQQESVEYVTLLVSCQKRAKRIRVPSCISSDDLAAFLKDVFGVAPGLSPD
ncbi:hypothetical protein EBZ37_08605 [bacterium]|nr:hypothetical protein [bacterium]